MRRTIISVACLSLLLSCSRAETRKPVVDVVIDHAASTSKSARSSSHGKSPKSLLISVPFSPQAPFANWDALHEESCEEASLIMVMHFWNGEPLDQERMESEILELVRWEEERGYPQDVTAEQLAVIAEQYFEMRAIVSTDVSIQSIKAALDAGKPVIVPAAGRDLGNPYFSGEGPWYHMLVITGYEGNRFITNDPGTKRGENFTYRQDVLLAAIHDWTGVKEEIRTGRKAMLVVEGKTR